MRALVIGYGSIGRRHTDVLKGLSVETAVVSRFVAEDIRTYETLEDALQDWHPDYVVIANRTSQHIDTIEALARSGYEGKVLVEKPIVSQAAKLPSVRFSGFSVGYNLRFHPLLQKLRRYIQNDKQVINASVYLGSYLPAWRPKADYRTTNSSRKSEGGGVLRDASHELDYVRWLFGSWTSLCSAGGQLSHLEIDSEDVFSIFMKCDHCPLVTVHLNYLDRRVKREIIVNTMDHTYTLDLVGNVLLVDHEATSVSLERNDTYRDQHVAMLGGGSEVLCSPESALEVARTIEAIEWSASNASWIHQ